MFGPIERGVVSEDFIVMTVAEYETLRLIDYEGMTQEECSKVMGVARTTVQRIYSIARKKIALSLVKGRILKIEGGEYKLYTEREQMTNPGSCHRHRRGRGRNRF